MDERDSVNASLLRTVIDGKGLTTPALLSRTPQVQLPVSREKVQYYVRLGFPQEIVESTIASLGPGAHDNDIMHRLNMRGAVAPPPRPVVITEETTPPGPAPTPVVDGILSSPNLRPIVVDGSNVAMRYVPKI